MKNRFSQDLHNGGKIFDKRNWLSIGIQFIDADWEKNHDICLGMTPLSDGSAGPTAELLRAVSLERMGATFDDTVASLLKDKAASAVARSMDYEVDPCDMHELSKLSESAVVVLVKSKTGKPVNPFEEGKR